MSTSTKKPASSAAQGSTPTPQLNVQPVPMLLLVARCATTQPTVLLASRDTTWLPPPLAHPVSVRWKDAPPVRIIPSVFSAIMGTILMEAIHAVLVGLLIQAAWLVTLLLASYVSMITT